MKRRVQNRKWKQRFIVRAASVSLWMCMAVAVPVQVEGETEDAVIQYEQNASVLSASARQYRKGLESLNSASSQLSMRDQADAALRKLAIFLGKEAEEIEIGKMPVIEAKQLEALSLLTDRETAVIALCEAYEEYQWAMRGV